MNKTNKVRKGEVRIYGGKTYVAIPEIKEDHCAGCCFYNEGCCSICDFDHMGNKRTGDNAESCSFIYKSNSF